MQHGIERHMSTSGLSAHAAARRLYTAKLEEARAKFNKMFQRGDIQRSSIP